MPSFPKTFDAMDGVPRQFCPARPSSTSPPSSPQGDVLALRVLRRASRKRHVEPTCVTSAESSPRTNPDRKLKLGDVLSVFAGLLGNREDRAAMLLVEELASSGLAQSELQSTLVTFKCQRADFVNKRSSELGEKASAIIQFGGQRESSAKTEVDVGIEASRSDDSTVSARSASNPVPDIVSDTVQFGGQEGSSIKTEVEADRGATKRCDSKASTRSVFSAGSSMRESVLKFCRRARSSAQSSARSSTMSSPIASFSSMSDQEIREDAPYGRRSACSEFSRSASHSLASYRYSSANTMIEVWNQQHQVRGHSYDGVMPSELRT